MESRIIKKPRVASIAGIYDWSIYNLHFYAILKNKKKKKYARRDGMRFPLFLMSSIHINFLQKIYIQVHYKDGCELKVDNWR